MLNPAWLDRYRPRSGMLLIERETEPYQYKGLVYIPEIVRGRRRPPLAKILHVGDSVDPSWGLFPGQSIMVSAAAGQPVVFGSTSSDSRTLYTCFPTAVLGIIHTDQVGPATEHHGRFEARHATDDILEEGKAEHGYTT